MHNNNKIIARIESELLSTLFNYVVPFIDKKIKTSKKIFPKKSFLTNRGNLENIVNSKPKIDFKDVKELELLLLNNLSNDVKVDKNTEINSDSSLYLLNLKRQKNNNEKFNKYSISMKYEENQQEEKLSITTKKSEEGIWKRKQLQ